MDYEQFVPGVVHLRIAIPKSDVVTYRLDQFGLGRHVLKFNLPEFLGNGLKPGPRHAGSLTASSQRMDPSATHFDPERYEAPPVLRHGVVSEVALYDSSEPLTLNGQRQVPPAHQFLAN